MPTPQNEYNLPSKDPEVMTRQGNLGLPEDIEKCIKSQHQATSAQHMINTYEMQ